MMIILIIVVISVDVKSNKLATFGGMENMTMLMMVMVIMMMNYILDRVEEEWG